MTTVVVAAAAFEDRLTAMTLPRVLLTPHLMGRPLSLVHDTERQRAVLLAALKLLEEAPQVGSLMEFTG